METGVLILSGPKPNAANSTPMMLQMKFDHDRPAGIRGIHVRKCGPTDERTDEGWSPIL